MRDMREVFSVCLGYIVPEADIEELEIFMREDVLVRLQELLDDDKEDFVKQIGEIIIGLSD